MQPGDVLKECTPSLWLRRGLQGGLFEGRADQNSHQRMWFYFPSRRPFIQNGQDEELSGFTVPDISEWPIVLPDEQWTPFVRVSARNRRIGLSGEFRLVIPAPA